MFVFILTLDILGPVAYNMMYGETGRINDGKKGREKWVRNGQKRLK